MAPNTHMQSDRRELRSRRPLMCALPNDPLLWSQVVCKRKKF